MARNDFLLTDDQRRRLAVKGKFLGRKVLEEVGTLFTPDTILRWHRTLVAQKWDYSDRRKSVGRPRIRQVIVDLILRFARENPSWGYDRIQGAGQRRLPYLRNDRGQRPQAAWDRACADRKRPTTWKTFIKSHWDVLAAIDFTTIEVWTRVAKLTVKLKVTSDSVGCCDTTTGLQHRGSRSPILSTAAVRTHS